MGEAVSRVMSERVRAHLLAHPAETDDQAAAALGLTAGSVATYRSWLRTDGHAIPSTRRRLSPDELAEAIDLLDSGRATADVARRFGLRWGALVMHLLRRGYSVRQVRQGGVFTTPALLNLLGYSIGYRGKFVARLRRAGLRMRRANNRAPWLIAHVDFMEWLATPAARELIRPEQIADPGWREYAREAMAGKVPTPTPIDVALLRGPVKHLCVGCGAEVSGPGKRCKSCAQLGNQNARRSSKVAA
jgi:transposase-like protein